MTVDYFYIPEDQGQIHERLENWADWLRPRLPLQTSHMFLMCKSGARQWHQPQIRKQCDLIDAHKVEVLIRNLPAKNREALRWYYVKRYSEKRARIKLGLNQQQLHDLVIQSRYMVR